MARLVVLEGKKVGASVELGEGKISVGRLASCELAIDEPQASRKHFEVEKRKGAAWVKDLGSKNGTFLNDTRVDGEAALRDGDKLRVGATVVAYEAAPAALPPGTKIGPYELAGVHERREGLTVHEARHSSLARNVHVEVLDPGDKLAPAFLARARAASAYDHPVLLAVFDAGEHDGRAYRVRESWPDARDLDARLREGRLPAGFALGIAQQVATGLAHIHAKGGVHGWLTPRVVLVNDTGAVKLEVVGGDRLLRLDPLRQDARLQALSISPEEARGLDATAKSDVYALGCVLYRALTGVPPFDGELAQVIRAHAGEGDAPRIGQREPALAGDVEDLVHRMLAKKADARPSADEAAKELAALAPKAGSAEPPKPLKPRASAGTWGAVSAAKPEPAPAPAPPPPAPPKKVAKPAPAASERPAPPPPAPRKEPEAPKKDSARAKPLPRSKDETEDTDETPRAIVTTRMFDPLRAALLGVVFFLLFFLSSQGTVIVLRVMGRR
ncbi:MAG TPA: FHA domain-containing serine/threonine-protein kinase [Planctomycetota bacterium]|nr:FHA domain-containing serine/threonine-protein kinase [Planctomycetota bacterium]